MNKKNKSRLNKFLNLFSKMDVWDAQVRFQIRTMASLMLLMLSSWCKGQIYDGANLPIKDSCGPCRIKAISLKEYGGEENWGSLAVLDDGCVLVGQSSRRANAVLLKINPENGDVRLIADLGTAGNLGLRQKHPKIHVTPVRDNNGQYHFFSHYGFDTHLPLHGSRLGYEGMRRWVWNPTSGTVEDRGLVMCGDGAVALNGDSGSETLFVVTFPRALLLEVDVRTGKVRNWGRTNAVYAPRHIIVDPWDNAYVLDHEGHFWILDRNNYSFHRLEKKLEYPSWLGGNLLAQGLAALAQSENRRRCLATSAWGQMYEINFTAAGKLNLTNMGLIVDKIKGNDIEVSTTRKVTAAGLAVGPDEKIYIAVSGYNRGFDDSGDSVIIRLSREEPTKAAVIARLDGTHISYICGSNAVHRESGRVFFVGNHLKNDSPYLVVIETYN